MTPAELVSLSLTVHSTSFVLSLPAIYAVFSEKLVQSSLERAEGICAKLRGKLSSELEQELSLLLGKDQMPTMGRAVLDQDGQPAQFVPSNPFRGDKLQQALREFLDSESDDFCRYHLAMRHRRTVFRCRSSIRALAAVWPLCTLLGIGLFGAFVKDVIPTPGIAWLWMFDGILVLPLALLLLHLPALAVATRRLESLEP